MAGESELLLVPARRWRGWDFVLLGVGALASICFVWAVIDRALFPALFYGLATCEFGYLAVRTPRRRVFGDGSSLIVVNRNRTVRIAMADISKVWIGQSFEGRAVFVQRGRRICALEATRGMSSDDLDALVSRISAAAEAHNASVGH